MLSYTETSRPEFTAIRSMEGVIYHQRGGFELTDETRTLIPVNRSYRPLHMPGSGNIPIENPYVVDRLIHDTVPNSADLIIPETNSVILGKTLLMLDSNEGNNITFEYSSKTCDNPKASDMSKETIDSLVSLIENSGLDIELGLHGSHQVSLNGVDSDLDLVAWTPSIQRPEALIVIQKTMEELGFKNANSTSKYEEYAIRIARLMGMPYEVGAYLALQRNRWVNEGGASTSLQLVHSDYQHQIPRDIIQRAFSGELEERSALTNEPIEVLDGSEPYNYPRVWNIAIRGEMARVISFNMVHQTMGSVGHELVGQDSIEYLINGKEYRDASGSKVYILREDGDYILPAHLFS